MTESFKTGIFTSKEEVRDEIMQILKSNKHIKDSDAIQFGYIMPGHGFKGKQRALQDDEDIGGMYDAYSGKKPPIILWAKITRAITLPRARKSFAEISDDSDLSSNSDSSSKIRLKQKTTNGDKAPRRTSYQNHLSKMSEVECIVGDLEEKHGEGKFSPEQILVWANMLQMKKHTSYDEPPNKAFFRNCKSNGN